jgi:hypothetical protein
MMIKTSRLIQKNTFGDNYKVIVPLIFYEDEFDFQSISDHELASKATSANYVGNGNLYLQ